MNKNRALENLLVNKASEDEIEFLKNLLLRGEISIGGNVNNAVIIVGDGNKVDLPSEILDKLNGRAFLGNLERDLTGEEIRLGLEKLELKLSEYAPVLLSKFQEQVRQLQPFIKTDPNSLSEQANQERVKALGLINGICLEALDISFNSLCLGEEPPEYDFRSPFRGLESFRPEDSEFFFGRELLVEKLVRKINDYPFLAVLGASGSGKSSLAMAGLIPALGLDYVIFRPGNAPLVTLEANLSSIKQGEVIVVDQFEELFTLTKDKKIHKVFISKLLEQTKLYKIVLTMRSDFLSEVAEYHNLNEEIQNHLENVSTMTIDDLSRAMEKQAKSGGLRFEADLNHQMLEDVMGEPGAMPLLQHALWELWNRRHGRWLRASEYRAFGGVKQAITHTAESLYRDFTDIEREQMRDIFLRLTRFDDKDENRNTGRRVQLEHLVTDNKDAINSLIDKLVGKRLVVKTTDNTKVEVEVAHEALIRYWDRLREWFSDDYDLLKLFNGVQQAAKEWEVQKKDTIFLIHRGGRLDDALSLRTNKNYKLNIIENEYVKSCLMLRNREQREREHRNRLITLTSIFLVIVFFCVALGFGGLGVYANNQAKEAQANARLAQAGELAALAISNLQIEPELGLLLAVEANKILYSAEAENALRQSLDTSRSIAIISGHNGPVWDASYSPDGLYFVTTSTDKTAQLWDAETNEPISEPLRHEHFVERAVISSVCPDGNQYVLTASRDGNARVWDFSGNITRKFSTNNLDPHWEFYGVAISSDCKYVATTNEHGLTFLWDFNNSEKFLRIYDSKNDSIINTVNFSPDNKFLLVASADERALIWNVMEEEEYVTEPVLELKGHSGPVRSATYSRAGAYIITASQDKTARIWSASTGEEYMVLRGHTNEVWYAELSPDVNFAVTTSSDGSVRLWSTFIGAQIDELRGHKGAVYTAKFSRDGKYLLTASEDSTARIWVATQAEAIFNSHGNWLFDIDFSPDNNYFATAGKDKKAVVWNISGNNLTIFAEGPNDAEKYQIIDSRKLILEIPHEEQVTSVNFCPNIAEHCLLTASGNTARIWDYKSGNLLREFVWNEAEVNSAKFSPTDSLVVTVSDFRPDGDTARIWDAETGQLLTTYYGPKLLGGMYDASFSPDGKHIVTAGNDGIARVWLVDKKQTKITTPVFELYGHTELISSIEYSHDGKYILTGGDFRAILWDANTGQIIRIFSGHKDMVSRASFDPTDKFIVTSGEYRAILWETDTGKQLAEFRDHTGPVQDAIFSFDGKYILTASQDNLARLFVCDLCGTIEELIALAESRVSRELTCEERNIYLHEDNTCSTSIP